VKTEAVTGSTAPSFEWNHALYETFFLRNLSNPLFDRLDTIVIFRILAAIFSGPLIAVAAYAEPPAAPNVKTETSCTTSSAANSGSGVEKTSNSMAVEKSAILPDAGGADSAAPTVQSGGKPMEVRSDCPPDSKSK